MRHPLEIVDFAPPAKFEYRYRSKILKWLLEVHPFLRDAFRRVFPKLVEREFTVSERVAEIPFALRALQLPSGSRVLDVGSRWSIFPLNLVSLGYRTVATDLARLPYGGAGPDVVRADIRRAPFRPNSFDAATLISTLEHVGVGAYDARRGSDDDIALVRELHGIVKPGGILVLTVPYGVGGTGPHHRAYDAVRLARATDGWVRDEEHFYVRDGLVWREETEAEAASLDSAVFVRAVVMLRLHRK